MGKVKKMVRPAVATLGILMPNPQGHVEGDNLTTTVHTVPSESQVTDAEYQKYVIASPDQSSESPSVSESEAGLFHPDLNNLSENTLEQLSVLFYKKVDFDKTDLMMLMNEILSREMPDTKREQFMRDYVTDMIQRGTTLESALEILDNFDVSVENTQWLRETITSHLATHPEYLLELQPDWPNNPPDEIDAERLERGLSEYLKYRTLLENVDSPKTHVLLELLDSSWSRETKEDVLLLLDDVAGGALTLEQAASMTQDKEKLFSHLVEQERLLGPSSEKRRERLLSLANPYLNRQRVLDSLPGFTEQVQ